MSGFDFALGSAGPAVESRLRALDTIRFAARLWQKDPTLWGADPATVETANHRLGWLDIAGRMRAEVASLDAFAAEAAREGFTRAVLLGMGGSSLAPEVLRRVLGVRAGRLDLTVLDDTSPAAVRAVAESHDPGATLVVVSSKSGTTIEVSCIEALFREAVAGARDHPGRSFVAITDAGTPLEARAREHGWRRVFLNPPDIGGRYSALSWFGLVPAALIGADLDALLESAERESRRSGPEVPAAASPAVVLGAALGELAIAGRDKLTLVLVEEIAPLGDWIEQLVAESTGKLGRGILPVVGEELAGPQHYGDDRVFVAIAARPLPPQTESRLAALRDAGHPVLRWRLRDLAELGGEFLGWQIATATAGAVLGVNPFDEPDVTEAKRATREALDGWRARGRFDGPAPLASAGAVEAYAPAALAGLLAAALAGRGEPWSWAAALAALARPGDFMALLAYFHRTPERHARLQRLRHALRERTRAATTLGWGPRYLHSTGQLHKGGPGTGLFLMLTADEGDLAIPGEPYGFGTLRMAQALGDAAALERRGRRLVRLHLGAGVEAGLDRLVEAVEAPARA